MNDKSLKELKAATLVCLCSAAITIIMVILFCLLLSVSEANASPADPSDEEIVNAIYWAEGGPKTNHPYGVLSVKCDSSEECRRICRNTVRNNRKRFSNQTLFTDYLEFLSSRYAPIGAGNDPTNLNKNWLKNVRWFINNPKEVKRQ